MRMLVAGVGNVFLGDDGFGAEVVRRLGEEPQPAGVKVADFGIRGGLHLAYELLDGYDTTVLVDAAPRAVARARSTWSRSARRISRRCRRRTSSSSGALSSTRTALAPVEVLALVATLGGTPGRVVVLGCEPASVEEPMGLSEPVARAVDVALGELRRLIGEVVRPAAVGRERR